MSDSEQITLRQMQAGRALGIRPGKRITKVGSMFMRGPVTVQLDSTQVAIGFGMANKVIVELG